MRYALNLIVAICFALLFIGCGNIANDEGTDSPDQPTEQIRRTEKPGIQVPEKSNPSESYIEKKKDTLDSLKPKSA